MEPRKKNIRSIFLICCYLSAVLAPVGWLYFTLLTRNTFRLNEFAREDLVLCALCALVPAFCNILAWILQRRGPVLRGWLPACGGFVLAAAGWLVTLSTQWSVWDVACSTGIIGSAQRGILRAACLTGLAAALLAMLPVAVRVARTQREA